MRKIVSRNIFRLCFRKALQQNTVQSKLNFFELSIRFILWRITFSQIKLKHNFANLYDLQLWTLLIVFLYTWIILTFNCLQILYKLGIRYLICFKLSIWANNGFHIFISQNLYVSVLFFYFYFKKLADYFFELQEVTLPHGIR